MKLVVETLYTSLEQELLCLSEDRVQIGAIIPYLYFHNVQSGNFKFELFNESQVVYTHLFSYLDIKAQIAENYMHVYYPIIPSDPVQVVKGEYKVKLSVVSDYIVSGNSFLGWIKQHEDIQLPMAYNPVSDIQNTFTLRFKVYKEGIWLG